MKSLDVECVSEKLTKNKEMTRLSYDTDLTDYQWQILKLLIPPAKTGGRNRSVNIREVLNAIFYLLANGIKWRAMPHDFPKWIVLLREKNLSPKYRGNLTGN